MSNCFEKQERLIPMDDYRKNIEKIMTAIELWTEYLKLENKSLKIYLEEYNSKKKADEWEREEREAQDEALGDSTSRFDNDFQTKNT